MKSLTLVSVVAIAGLIITSPSTVYGKLVYEKDLRAQMAQTGEGTTAQLTENYQDPVIDVQEPKRIQTQTIIQQPVAVQPVAVQSTLQVPVVQTQELSQVSQPAQPMTKSEQLRRQRMREELKNEDLLTQKLEELRLKDEMTRSQQILGSGVDKTSEALEEKKVGAAATAEVAPATATVVSSPASAQSFAVMPSTAAQEDSTENRVRLTPRVGLSGITNSMYDIRSKYSLGISAEVDLNNYVSFSAGYTYSTYNLNAGNSIYNPYGYQLQTLDLNDNVIDMGVRFHLTNAKSKIRPFIGAGGGYRRGYLNYDDKTIEMLKAYNFGQTPEDIELSAFLGYVETGLDFKISNNVSITGSVRYYNVFSSTQSKPVNANAFMNPSNGYSMGGYNAYGYNSYGYASTGTGNGSYGYTSDTKNQAGKALADNNFYQLMLGLSVNF